MRNVSGIFISDQTFVAKNLQQEVPAFLIKGQMKIANKLLR